LVWRLQPFADSRDADEGCLRATMMLTCAAPS
jgi:hypothetical protein